MFEYKDASFYTSYFKNLEDFKIIEEFKLSEEEKEQNLIVGMVEVLNTIHTLIVRVEIPISFPHKKLTFRTKSISGYPHLIDNKDSKHGAWFCLNTPFAETAENQLEQEVYRLREWILRQLREDLPPIIKDPQVTRALSIVNAYGWENIDEVKEINPDAELTFIGDFYTNPDYFKENIGHFHCIKTEDNRYYALNESTFKNHKMPYIIVDEQPNSINIFEDFVKLREYYKWDDSICMHLLPELNTKQWDISTSLIVTFEKILEDINNKLSHKEIEEKYKCTESEALNIINKYKEELLKEDSYLPIDSKNLKKILPLQKGLFVNELNKLEEKIKNEHGFKENFDFLTKTVDDDDSLIEESERDYFINIGKYLFHYFCIGIKSNNKIDWIVVSTNHNLRETEKTSFNLELKYFNLFKLLSYKTYLSAPQTISNDLYFGRGAFSKKLIDKKIAIIGLGAIGSLLTESLARSGVCNLGLWDSDIVEPGNICRSAYDIRDAGESKVKALAKKIRAINPLCNIKAIKANGYWMQYSAVNIRYINGAFYDNINYNNQEDAIKQIKDYDLIIDCTGRNEILHFLSYAVPQSQIISLCITNHANDLLCVTSRNGNPFELRKAYLSRIEQDTKNYYVEGSGCYSPTFLATNSDIASLVNLAAREINLNMEQDKLLTSTIWSHDKRGVIADRLETYKLDGYDIRMTISSETIYDGEDIDDIEDGPLGYLLGSYSKDGLMIMVTHIVDAFNAEHKLQNTFETSKGIIDYIGDFAYSKHGSYKQDSFDLLSQKATDESINTCNPMLAVRNTDRTLSFFLYINNQLVPFKKEE